MDIPSFVQQYIKQALTPTCPISTLKKSSGAYRDHTIDFENPEKQSAPVIIMDSRSKSIFIIESVWNE